MFQRALCGLLIVQTNWAWVPACGASDPRTPQLVGLPDDDPFLDQLERDSSRFFWERASNRTGLIADSTLPGSPSSIASVGFGLAALCIAAHRGWISRNQVYGRVLKTLKTFRDRVESQHGFFYHFVEMDSGRRAWNSEVSSIDTTFLLTGALFAGRYFQGTEVEQIAQTLYERVDWPWMLHGNRMLCMGWKPEEGFLGSYWDWYSEGLLAYALAIGSPTHPIPAESWFQWKRATASYQGYDVVYSYFGSLFTYQFAQAWIDFRKLYDGPVNYWKNSVSAALANRHFCLDHAAEHRGYGEDGWGLTAGAGPDGYKGYGAEPAVSFQHDGTINPYGMVASLPLVPFVALPSMKALYAAYGDQLYGEYGFRTGFNLDRGWWAHHYIGIEQGVSVLMIENYRSGLVWNVFMQHPAIQRWISLCLRREEIAPSAAAP